MRTFEYRLYPNREQSSLLMQCLIESRMLYNQMLEMVKTQYAEQETFLSKYDLEYFQRARRTRTCHDHTDVGRSALQVPQTLSDC